MRRIAIEYAETGLRAAKFAVAALVLDENGNVLTCYHDTREGESGEGAIGSVTETLRYLQADPEKTETPVEALRRCLDEEHNIGDGRLSSAGFYFDRNEPGFFGNWPVGVLGGVLSVYPSFNVIIRVEDPSVFLDNDRPSEEILGAEFMHAESLLNTQKLTRPGFVEWFDTMIQFVGATRSNLHVPIDWPELPATGRDARYPF